MRGHLKGLRNTLEAARKKWVQEENEIEAKRKQLTEEMVMRLLKNEERRKAFEDRWHEVKERNRNLLDEGSWVGPIVPIGWGAPEAPTSKKDEAEAHGEQVSFLRALEEEPEEGPRVSEGGSSGSSGPAPPEAPVPEVPPPCPPPPEAPPIEGDSSTADGVRQRIAEAPARLSVEAYVALEEEFIAVAKPEDLRQEDRELYEAVRGTGLGVCARCRLLSGCQSCDEVKAWGFACRNTLWHTASEVLRPKAKPRGRPKRAA